MDHDYTWASIAVPPHKAGRPFLAASAVVLLVGVLFWHFLALAGLILLLFCLFFFRDPARVPPLAPLAVVAPADGVVTIVDRAPPPPELDLGLAPRHRICTFLSVLNVHVNRMPADGTVSRVAYRAGTFVNASLDKASDQNERNSVAVTLPDGRSLAVVQIAGLIARRILCDVRQGDAVVAGGRFGIIRFGSRVDLYLPEGVTPLVRVGQTMVGGETVVAMLTPAAPDPVPVTA
jgi:phosphatidylserine decarboxylase